MILHEDNMIYQCEYREHDKIYLNQRITRKDIFLSNHLLGFLKYMFIRELEKRKLISELKNHNPLLISELENG